VTPGGDPLRATLERARTLGFLGPGPIEVHLAHATGFATIAEDRFGRAPVAAVDLGAGGGVPGLVLALRWPATRVLLVESSQRRTAHLRRAVEDLELGTRVEVYEERAELTARRPELREQVELVTARSFAGPAITAEIAAGLVAIGGLLVVSEPPAPDPRRWPRDELAGLGFDAPQYADADAAHFVSFAKTMRAPDEVPRAPGRPGKRPRW
jgi:16S rRNA (guanine527-N7)-methyltransferase